MIVYATEDANGNLTGLFARPQAFFQTVEIDDADPKVTAFMSPPAPVPTCLLWQLQAALTPGQWTAAQAAVMAANNPMLTAFFSHGGNPIPANSITLAALAVQIGVPVASLPALITTASAVVVP